MRRDQAANLAKEINEIDVKQEPDSDDDRPMNWVEIEPPPCSDDEAEAQSRTCTYNDSEVNWIEIKEESLSDDEPRIHCSVKNCKDSFTASLLLEQHVKSRHKDYVKCQRERCNVYVKESCVKIHEKIMHEQKVEKMKRNREFCCNIENCKSAFVTPAELRSHVKKTHAAPVRCPRENCGKYLRPKSLKMHLKLVHGNSKQKCENCGEERSVSNLAQHMRRCLSRGGERRFACSHEDCNAAFTTSANRDAHFKRVHVQREKCPFEGCEAYVKPFCMPQHVKAKHKKKGIIKIEDKS